MEKKNSIEKQKGALTGIGIAVLILCALALAGGVLLIAFGAPKIATSDTRIAGIIMLVAGIILAIIGLVGLGFGIYATWIGSSVKATHGSIAMDNLSKGTVNGKKCPKCGATNSSDVAECQVCHTPLE